MGNFNSKAQNYMTISFAKANVTDINEKAVKITIDSGTTSSEKRGLFVYLLAEYNNFGIQENKDGIAIVHLDLDVYTGGKTFAPEVQYLIDNYKPEQTKFKNKKVRFMIHYASENDLGYLQSKLYSLGKWLGVDVEVWGSR